MKYIPGQHWQDKIEILRRRIANRRIRAERYTSPELTEADRKHVDSLTRFERLRGRVIKQNWNKPVVTNA